MNTKNTSTFYLKVYKEDIFNLPNLSNDELLLYSLISSLSKNGNSCTASNTYLAEQLGRQPRTIQYTLSKLVSHGAINRSLDTKKQSHFTERFLTPTGIDLDNTIPRMLNPTIIPLYYDKFKFIKIDQTLLQDTTKSATIKLLEAYIQNVGGTLTASTRYMSGILRLSFKTVGKLIKPYKEKPHLLHSKPHSLHPKAVSIAPPTSHSLHSKAASVSSNSKENSKVLNSKAYSKEDSKDTNHSAALGDPVKYLKGDERITFSSLSQALQYEVTDRAIDDEADIETALNDLIDEDNEPLDTRIAAFYTLLTTPFAPLKWKLSGKDTEQIQILYDYIYTDSGTIGTASFKIAQSRAMLILTSKTRRFGNILFDAIAYLDNRRRSIG